MNIQHHKKLIANPFRDYNDLAEVSELVRNTYNPTTCNCEVVAGLISKMYSSITPVEIKCMVHDGTIQTGGHVVCKIEGTDFLLDPTGDYVEYNNLSKLKHDIVPWLYQWYDDGEFYLSQNHMPMQPSAAEDEREGVLTEWDVLRLTSGPFYNGLRSISI